MEYITIELIGIIVGSIATVLGGVWFIVNKAINFGRTIQRVDDIEKKTLYADCESHQEAIKVIKEEQLPQRVEQIEKKTLHANCESHNDLIRRHEITFNNIQRRFDNIENTLKKHDERFDSIEKKFDKIDEKFNKIDEKFNEVNENFKAINKEIFDLNKDIVSIKSFLSVKFNGSLKALGLKNSPMKLNNLGNQIFTEINGKDLLNNNKDYLLSEIEKVNPRTALDVENVALMTCIDFSHRKEFDKIKNFIYNSPEYTFKDEDGHDVKYNLSLHDICFVLSLPLRDMYLERHPEVLENM